MAYTPLLTTNLELLFLNHPAPEELQRALRKNIFSVPNQKASDELIRYLYAVIDEKYKLDHCWPILDKKMENNFYTLVHKFSKEISAEYPEEELPKVVKSFFLMPSGERYVQYLYKLSLIAMRNDMKASGINMCPRRMPARELQAMNDYWDDVLKEQAVHAVQSRETAKKRKLKLQLERKRETLSRLTAELKLKVEKCSLPEHMKHCILSGHDRNVINEWSAMLSQRCEKLRKDAEVIKDIKRNISQLNKAIKIKKNITLEKSLGNQELLNRLSTEDFLNDMLRRGEETLNARRLEGTVDWSPYIPDLEELAKQLKDLLDIVAQCSETMIQLHDDAEERIPELKAAVFSNERLAAKNIEEEDVGYSQSLVNMLCESTPPEIIRNFKFAQLGQTSATKTPEMESQNTAAASRMDAVDVAAAAEACTPVAVDTNLLKTICFQHKSNGSGATWKQALFLSTLKKKQQEKENRRSDSHSGKSPESLTDTPLSQHCKRATNPVKSLNNFWTENCRNDCASKRIPHSKYPCDKKSPEESSSTVDKQFQMELYLKGLPDTSILQFSPGTSASEPQPVEPAFIEERNKICNLTVDQRHFTEDFSIGNISQEVRDFLQGVTNSNGSFMGASEVFGSSSSPSPSSSIMTGVDILEQTSTDSLQISSCAGASLVLWDDQRDLKRILSVALSPVGIPSAEVRSSTPIEDNSSQPEQSVHVKDCEKLRQPAAAAHAESRIPRIRSLGEMRLKKKSTILPQKISF